jgi:dGTPase
VRDELEKAKRVITALFEHVVAHPEDFLPRDSEETTERLAIDFVAGMTDRYAINLYERLFVPRAWV